MGEAEFKARLEKSVQTARDRLHSLQETLEQIHKEDMEALQQRRKEAKQRVEAQRQHAESLRDKVRDKVKALKEQRDKDKLEHRAERAEEDAFDAVTMVAWDLDVAESAVLDAVEARWQALEKEGSSTPS